MSNLTGFCSSGALAFIRSPGKARGAFNAGIKTAHYCAPYGGYGNTIDPTTGTISTDPNIPWTYSKMVVQQNWNYTTSALNTTGPDLNTQQSLANPGYSIGDTVTGYLNTTYTLTDLNSLANIPNYPGQLNQSGSFTSSHQTFPWFDVSGTTLTPHSSASSATTGPTCPFDTIADPYDTAWNKNYSWYITAQGVQTPFEPTIPVTENFSTTITVSGGTVTTTFSANKWRDANNGQPGQSAVVSALQSPISGYPNGYYIVADVIMYFEEKAEIITTTTYSHPINLSDLETQANIALALIYLQDTNQQFYFFDGSNAEVLLYWAASAIPYGGIEVKRATYSGGTLGSYSNLANVSTNSYIDSTAVVGTEYSYVIQGAISSVANPVAITVNAPDPPVFQGPVNNLAPIENYSVANYSSGLITELQHTLTAAITGPSLVWSTIAAPWSQSQIVLYPIDGLGHFVISSQASCGTPPPFYLAGRAVPYNQTPLSLALAPAGSVVWTKSRGYLPGNSPNHNPPTSSIEEKFYYIPANFIGTGQVDETANFPPLQFVHGRSGNYPVTLTRDLPTNAESWGTSNVPGWGYLLYK